MCHSIAICSPRFLNYRAVSTLGYLTLSTNLSNVSSGCTLHFICEDATISLAPYRPTGCVSNTSNTSPTPSSASSSSSRSSSGVSSGTSTASVSKITVLPASELVCLLDLGFFEISLRLNDQATARAPKLDLRATVSDLHLRTCADSGEALCQLITYLSTNGDLLCPTDDGADELPLNQGAPLSNQRGPVDPLISTADETALPVANATVLLTPAQHQRVAALMEDAMQEVPHVPRTPPSPPAPLDADAESSTSSSEPTHSDDDPEVFFFPDEAAEMQQRQAARRLKVRSQSTCLPNIGKSTCNETCSSASGGNPAAAAAAHDDNADRLSMNSLTRELLNFEANQADDATADASVNSAAAVRIEAHPQVAHELGNVAQPVAAATGKQRRVSAGSRTSSSRRSAAAAAAAAAAPDTDDEFCIIGEEERPRCGFETVPISNPREICFVENHFSVPAVQADLLQAPSHFPMAGMRYTLCELTLTWHLYGGQDFETTPANG